MAASDNFRENLKTAMELRGVSQSDVARAIDPSGEGTTYRPWVNRVLRGKTVPALDQCESLARAVKMPLSVLIGSPTDLASFVLTPVTT